MFHKLRELRKFQTSKVTFKDIQGHWQWCHSIGHIWFPISVRLQLCLDLAPLTRYYYLFPKFKEVMWDIHIPFKGNIWCVHNTRNLKCLASPIPKNWDKILKNGSRDPDHAHYGVVYHRKPSTWYILPAQKIGYFCFSHSGDMTANVKLKNGWCDTDHTPLEVVCHP